MIPRLLGLSLVAALALTGCAPAEETATPTPTTTAATTQPILNAELVPLELATVTSETAAAESLRLLDGIQALIDSATIVSATDQAEVVAAEDDVASYYALSRTIMLDETVDALTLGETLAAVLEQSGWVTYDSVTEGDVYISTLVGGSAEVTWFLVVSGDASTAGQSSITLQVASPDLAA